MTACQDIIKSAYRRSGIVAAGVTLNASQYNIGMERLIELYNRGIDTGLFGRLTDYYLASGNYTIQEWQRVYKASGASVVTFPANYSLSSNTPNDFGFAGSNGALDYEQVGGGVDRSSDGNYRAPRDGAVGVVVDPATSPFTVTTKIYDSQAGWMPINGLTRTSYAPLSARAETHLKNLLAIDLLGENGQQPDPVLLRNASVARMYIGSKYHQPRASARADYS